MRIALLVALLLPDGCRGGGKASRRCCGSSARAACSRWTIGVATRASTQRAHSRAARRAARRRTEAAAARAVFTRNVPAWRRRGRRARATAGGSSKATRRRAATCAASRRRRCPPTAKAERDVRRRRQTALPVGGAAAPARVRRLRQAWDAPLTAGTGARAARRRGVRREPLRLRPGVARRRDGGAARLRHRRPAHDRLLQVRPAAAQRAERSILETLPNVGRCDHAYAMHAARRYDRLEPLVFFLKDSSRATGHRATTAGSTLASAASRARRGGARRLWLRPQALRRRLRVPLGARAARLQPHRGPRARVGPGGAARGGVGLLWAVPDAGALLAATPGVLRAGPAPHAPSCCPSATAARSPQCGYH